MFVAKIQLGIEEAKARQEEAKARQAEASFAAKLDPLRFLKQSNLYFLVHEITNPTLQDTQNYCLAPEGVAIYAARPLSLDLEINLKKNSVTHFFFSG
jgi:hypothetical protein